MRYKELLIFSAGVAVGALSGVLITKASLRNKMSKDIEEVRQHYQRKYAEVEPEKLEPVKAKIEPAEAVEAPSVFQTSSINMNMYKDKVQSAGYSVPKYPVAITLNEFYSEEAEENYETVHLSYYEDDEILADDEDHVVFLADTIGVANLDNIGKEEKDIGYFRCMKRPNEQYGTQYCVTWVHGSYEQLTGLNPNDMGDDD